LFPHKAGGSRFPTRIQAGFDAETDARPRRVRRKIYDRLPKGISSELVQTRETFARSRARVAELFWRGRIAISVGMAPQRLDSTRRPARLVPMVLPILLRSP